MSCNLSFPSIALLVEGMNPRSRLHVDAIAQRINELLNPPMDDDMLSAIVECLVPIHWKHGERGFIDLLLENVKRNEENSVTVHRIKKVLFNPNRDDLWVRNAFCPALRLAGNPSPSSVCSFIFASPEQAEKIALRTARRITNDPVLSRAFWGEQKGHNG